MKGSGSTEALPRRAMGTTSVSSKSAKNGFSPVTLRTLLNADKKGYVVNFTQTLIVIFNVLFALISVFIYY